jgi:CRP-like cAMP-binding protein
MEAFINYLLLFGDLNAQQIDFIKSKGVERELKKGTFYSEAGTIPREIIFLLEGIVRISYYNNKGDDITKYFIDENNLVVDIMSYQQGMPSSAYIECITDLKYISFSKEALNDISLTIIQWDTIMSKIIAKALAEKVNRISPMLSEDATERYRNFLTKFPGMANRIPLSYLASYLGITQSSLSRIRKNFNG